LAALQQENQSLCESVKRKDTVIDELKQKAAKAADQEQINKTASTSRESDRHLLEREATILRRKNKELSTSLKAKEQTVKDLLQMVSRMNSQNGFESSAAEDNDFEDEASGASRRASVMPMQPGVAAVAASVASSSGAAADERSHGGAHAQDMDDEPEIEELASKLAMLESAVAGITFHPPSRTNVSAQATPALNARAKGALQAASLLAAEDRLPAPSQAHASGGSARAGVTGLGSRSIAALDVLARELAVLEEKKRVVEDLAKNLDPASDDDEEDDGFPLR
jgi:hypothetical protein